jgi:hypothetical protein
VRIFLSYGHDDYVALALRLKHDLEAQSNNKVWFDIERLKPGGDWERYIEDGASTGLRPFQARDDSCCC